MTQQARHRQQPTKTRIAQEHQPKKEETAPFGHFTLNERKEIDKRRKEWWIT